MTTPRLNAGDRLADRYEVLSFLGGGGFGEVYRGRDAMIGREVAIKVLNFQGEADAEVREGLVARFRREARVAAQIRHPNVITIHDIGVTELGDPFLVMELLSGHDLFREITRGGAMAPTRVLPLFIGCLDALGEAHRQGIVHKDLKPENLFLIHPGTHRETLTIFDFGISHVIQDGRLTMTGQMIGTPSYMAPEYVDRQEVTPAFDVYQMGLILVESLTARAVIYDDNPTQCFVMHSRGDVYIQEELGRGPLGPVIARALALDPGDRFEDAEAFRAALAGIDPASVKLDPTIRTTLHLAVVARLHGLSGATVIEGRSASDTVAAPTLSASSERATAPSTPPPALGAKVTSVSGPNLIPGFGRRPKADTDTPTVAGVIDPGLLIEAAAPARPPDRQTDAFVPHDTGASSPPASAVSGGSVVVSRTLMHQAIDAAAAAPAPDAPAPDGPVADAGVATVDRPREATALVAGSTEASEPAPLAVPELLPAAPKELSNETEELRSIVEREKAVTGPWGFLLVTGVLGLVVLLMCPVSSAAWVTSRALTVESRALDAARTVEAAALELVARPAAPAPGRGGKP